MRRIVWVLLIGPPALAILTWLTARRWSSVMMQNQPRPWVKSWQKYDFWVILGIFYVVMLSAAVLNHKL